MLRPICRLFGERYRAGGIERKVWPRIFLEPQVYYYTQNFFFLVSRDGRVACMRTSVTERGYGACEISHTACDPYIYS